MPRCLEPGLTFSITLDSDAAKPAETQPRFSFRYPSNRQWQSTLRPVDGTKPDDEVGSILAVALAGWSNMIDPATSQPIPFALESLDLVCDPGERKELCNKLIDEVTLSHEDKKKSESP